MTGPARHKNTTSGHAETKTPDTRRVNSIGTLLVSITVVIFLTEFVVMLILDSFPNLTKYQEAATDSIFLVLLLLPTMYFLIYLPLQSQIKQLKATQTKLRASEQRFSDIASQAGEWIWEIDAEGRFTYSSPIVSEILGVKADEIIGRYFYESFLPEERDELTQVSYSIFSKKQAFTSFISRNLHTDGRMVTLETTALPLLDEDGNLIGYRGSDRDITERIHVESRLLSAKSAAEASNRAKSTFLANMSHELRTPINGTLGSLELLLMDDLAPSQIHLVETASESSRHLLELIDQLLQYSQLETHELEVNLQSFDPRALVARVDKAMRSGAVNKGLRLETACDPKLPAYLLGDQGHIASVVEHLIGSAIKFTHRGNVRLEADYQAKSNGPGILHLHVLDTGIGIPDSGIDKLFEEFTQLSDSPSRRYGGTGLGLALCRRLAHGMGGTIGADRRLSGGTIFWVSIPLEVTSETPVPDAVTIPAANAS